MARTSVKAVAAQCGKGASPVFTFSEMSETAFATLANKAIEIAAKKAEQLNTVKKLCGPAVYDMEDVGQLVNAARLATGLKRLDLIAFAGWGEYREGQVFPKNPRKRS